jgi:hypothetical protein
MAIHIHGTELCIPLNGGRHLVLGSRIEFPINGIERYVRSSVWILLQRFHSLIQRNTLMDILGTQYWHRD